LLVDTFHLSERLPSNLLTICAVGTTLLARAPDVSVRRRKQAGVTAREVGLKNFSSRLILSAFALLATAPAIQGQTATVLSHSVIVAQPPDAIHYEKAIGNFTSTSYPSYFLGTGVNGYVYDTQKGTNCSLGIPAEYYERSRAFTYPGDTYSGVIASLYTSVDWLENPLNWGSSLCDDWQVQPINPNRGAHELHLVDLDGDGQLDVLASGSEYPTLYATGFMVFQNSYNSWSLGAFAPDGGDSIDVIAINGVNGGARTNIVGCDAARGSGWTAHLIASTSVSGLPACNLGVSVASLSVGNRDIVIIASGEVGSVPPWTPGLGYYDPGSTPDSPWTFHQLDSTYTDVHQIATDVLNGTPFFTIAEQEQASPICNGLGYNDHGSSYSGCRVAIWAWNGNGFNTPTLVSNLGSHNQTLYQLNGVEYMAGANHDTYEATDPAYNLWTFNFTTTTTPPATLSSGTYNIKNPNTGDTMDLGWALNPQWGDGSDVYLYSYNNGPTQQINYTSGGQLQSAQNTSDYLYDKGGVLALGASGDTFSITSSGNGYTIQDKTAGGLYVNSASAIDPPNVLPLSSTPTVWMFPAVSGSTGGGGSLATGKPYTFQDGNGYTMDLGWALNPQWGDGAYVYLYSYNDNSGQQLTYTASGQLQSVENSGKYVYDDGGFLTVGSSGDTFTITSSGGGYTVYDNTVGLYENSPGKISPPNKLALSSTPTVWTATLQ
jgi:hypothetical protein